MLFFVILFNHIFKEGVIAKTKEKPKRSKKNLFWKIKKKLFWTFEKLGKGGCERTVEKTDANRIHTWVFPLFLF